MEIQDSIIDSEEDLNNYIIGTGFETALRTYKQEPMKTYTSFTWKNKVYIKSLNFFPKLNIYYIDYH